MPKQFIDLRVLAAIVVCFTLLGFGEYSLLTLAAKASQPSRLDAGVPATGVNTSESSATPGVIGQSLLASGVFVTPHGTAILAEPNGWKASISDDSASYQTYVIFNNGTGASMGVTIRNKTNTTGDMMTPQAFLELRANEMGGTPAPQIISEGPVTVHGVSGYMLEAKAQSYIVVGKSFNKGAVRERFYQFDTGSVIYFIAVSAPEAEWTADVPAIDASVATLQIH